MDQFDHLWWATQLFEDNPWGISDYIKQLHEIFEDSVGVYVLLKALLYLSYCEDHVDCIQTHIGTMEGCLLILTTAC